MIQKNSFGEFGDGGEKSAKWADLYLTLNYNREKNFTRLSILKAKEWVGNHDPNGRNYGFEIINYGSQLANIREVKKCTTCYGTGRNKANSECGTCAGIGYIDGFKTIKKIDKCPVCGSTDFQDIKGMKHCSKGHYCEK
jgi:predicted Zn-ribbon and HTH transcriptional regulator